MTTFRELKPRIISFIDENKLIQSKDKIVIAVSGGMDSMFLLHFLSDLRNELNIELVVGHVNHNIRSGSRNDEKFVQNQSKQLGIPFFVKILDFKNRMETENIEAWARRNRYQELNIIREELNFDKIATAHNSNDQIETIIHRISEKSGIYGLKGIHKHIGKIIRPLLEVSRKDIENGAKELNIDHIDDETNQDIKYTRNYFRHQVIPLWEDKYQNLGKAFQSVSNSVEDNIIVLSYFFKELEKKIVKRDVKTSSFSIALKLADELPLEVMTSFFGYLLGRENWRKHNWTKIKQIILNAKIGKIYQIDKFELLKDRYEWIIRPKLMVSQKTINIGIDDSIKFGNYTIETKSVSKISLDSNPNRECIDKEKIENKNLNIRYWQDGDIFKPIGLYGTKKISDYLIDSKVNTFEKQDQPVLTADDEIIWLCGHRLSEKVKIDDNTKQYLELSIKSNVG